MNINQHEGSKYLRWITAVPGTPTSGVDDLVSIQVDVYCVLEAFRVTSHPIGHAIKKLLCAGQRDKGSVVADLRGAIAAISRAIEQCEQESNESQPQDGSQPKQKTNQYSHWQDPDHDDVATD